MIKNLLNWIVAITFILLAVVVAFQSLLISLIYLLISTMFIPSFNNWLYTKENIKITAMFKVWTTIALLFFSGVLINNLEEQKVAELAKIEQAKKAAEQAKNDRITAQYYADHKSDILTNAQTALDNKDYSEVIRSTRPYIKIHDADLRRLNKAATVAINQINKIKRTKALLKKIDKLSPSSLIANGAYYAELVKLNPDNIDYRKKMNMYNNKILVKEQKELAAKARKKQIESLFSPWDGSHRALEKLIIANLNDPDSYEHDETVYWDQGEYLTVKTSYRARNGFGGMVRGYVKAKVSMKGDILSIIDQK